MAAPYLALPPHWRPFCSSVFPGNRPVSVAQLQQWRNNNINNGLMARTISTRLQGRLICYICETGFNPAYLSLTHPTLLTLEALVDEQWGSFMNTVNQAQLDPKQAGMYTFVMRDNSGNYRTFHTDIFQWQYNAAFRDAVIEWLSDTQSVSAAQYGAWWVEELSILIRLPGAMVGGARKRKRQGATIIQNFNSRAMDCMLRAVILGFTKEHHPPTARYLSHADTEFEDTERGQLMCELVDQLYTDTGIDRDIMCGLPEAKLIARHLSQRGDGPVVIFCFSSPSYEVLWRTSDLFDPKETTFIDLLLVNFHYLMIDRVHRRLKKQKKFCRLCCKTYNNKNHRCRTRFNAPALPSPSCHLCACSTKNHIAEWQMNGRQPNMWKTCDACNRVFMGEECFNEHLKPNYVRNFSMCDARWKCMTCNKTFRTPLSSNHQNNSSKLYVKREDHKCGELFCNGCREWIVPLDHYCPIQTYTPDQKDRRSVFYYDIESRVLPDDPERNHACVCLVILTDNHEDAPLVFYTVETAIEHMLAHPGIYIAHNGANYDTHILMRAFIRFKEPLTYKFVAGTGSRFFEVWVQHGGKKLHKDKAVILKDSYCFIATALKKFPKMFGGETIKGHFPFHLLNKHGVDYVGEKPPIEEFTFSNMSPKETEEIKEWHDALPATYNLKEEMVKYCIADTVVLRQGVQKFRELVQELGGLDPIKEASTIAGGVMRLFRHKFLNGEIGQITHGHADELKTYLVGGRTEVFVSYAPEIPDGKEVHYIDATSMYPTINANGLYPKGLMSVTVIGEPDTGLDYNAVQEAWRIETWPEDKCAIFVVDVKCPTSLQIPLLHDSGPKTRLLFSLRPKEKWGYTHMELQLALKHGYTITRLYKVYSWSETSIGFAGSREYIHQFFKLKLLASGLPSCNTPEENQTFCNKVNQLYDFKVKPSDFKANPGLRSVAKLLINCLWGKFAQKPGSCFSTTSVFGSNDLDRYEKLRCSSSRIIRFIGLPEDQALIISKGYKEDPKSIMKNTNVAIGIFTTAQARISLWTAMLKVGFSNVFYCDTDSIVGQMTKETVKSISSVPSWSLGGWTSELAKDDYITQWAAAGPKAYAYKTAHGKCVVKIKGHSLSRPEALSLNDFKVVADVVQHPETEYSVTYSRIERPKGNQEIFRVHTSERAKKFSGVPQKRVFLPFDPVSQRINSRPYNSDDVLPF